MAGSFREAWGSLREMSGGGGIQTRVWEPVDGFSHLLNWLCGCTLPKAPCLSVEHLNGRGCQRKGEQRCIIWVRWLTSDSFHLNMVHNSNS